MLDEMKKLQFAFPFKTLEDYMKRAGITNGYQSKPCLNPADPECPETAPNKKSQQVRPVDVCIRSIVRIVQRSLKVNEQKKKRFEEILRCWSAKSIYESCIPNRKNTHTQFDNGTRFGAEKNARFQRKLCKL